MLSATRLYEIMQLAEKLTNSLGITQYPINVLELIRNHYNDRYYIHFTEFHDNADVVANYYRPTDECIILINEKRYIPSLMKRLNFSLAHELGHIVLKHYDIIAETTEKGKLKLLEIEADEFAGQFLMPESEIAFIAKQPSFLSEVFNVSEAAVVTRLDRIRYRNRLAGQELHNRIQQRKDSFASLLANYR